MRRPQIKLIYFCIEDGNSPLFNDQLLIKRADNAPRRVTKISSRLSTIINGNDFNLQQGKYSYVLITLSCPFALSFRYHRPSVDQLLTDTSVKYRRTIGEVPEKCQRSVGEVSVNEKLYRPRHIWNDYRPCLDRVSSDYRPNLDRLSTATSTESRSTIDRLSTECRPTIDRYIDR